MASNAEAPSVVQLRDLDILQDHAPERLLKPLEVFAEQLDASALLVIDHLRSRIRLLPLRSER